MVIKNRIPIALMVGVALWGATLALYLSTLAPTLTWGNENIGVDGGELLAAANTLGIPHPPGYPTYTLLLKLFATVVPVGDLAYRGNLLSAILASGSVVLLYLVILRLCRFLRPDGPDLFWIGRRGPGGRRVRDLPPVLVPGYYDRSVHFEHSVHWGFVC